LVFSKKPGYEAILSLDTAPLSHTLKLNGFLCCRQSNSAGELLAYLSSVFRRKNARCRLQNLHRNYARANAPRRGVRGEFYLIVLIEDTINNYNQSHKCVLSEKIEKYTLLIGLKNILMEVHSIKFELHI